MTAAREVPRTSEDRGSLLADPVFGAARLPRAAVRPFRRRLGDGAGPELAPAGPGRGGSRSRLLDHGPPAQGDPEGHPTPEPGLGPTGPRVYGAPDRRVDPAWHHDLTRRRRVTIDPLRNRAAQRAWSAAA